MRRAPVADRTVAVRIPLAALLSLAGVVAACHAPAPASVTASVPVPSPAAGAVAGLGPALVPIEVPQPDALRAVEAWTLASQVLGEPRRIFVHVPPGYREAPQQRYPVLYVLDGGIDEDFVHVAEAMHYGAQWDLLKPALVVGIENTERRRDLVGPTDVVAEQKAAPHAGGAVRFRQFLRRELMPSIRERYRTDDRDVLIGESLAGLFVVETLVEEPDLFEDYVALDPSLWWNRRSVVGRARERIAAMGDVQVRLSITTANEPDICGAVEELAEVLKGDAPKGLVWEWRKMPEEFHDTVYRAGAPRALRGVFGR